MKSFALLLTVIFAAQALAADHTTSLAVSVPNSWYQSGPSAFSTAEVTQTFTTSEKDGSSVTISLKKLDVALKTAVPHRYKAWRQLVLTEYGHYGIHKERFFTRDGHTYYQVEFEYGDQTATMEPAIVQAVVIDGALYTLSYNMPRDAFNFHLPTVKSFMNDVRLAPPHKK
jgi:hypothetical protein